VNTDSSAAIAELYLMCSPATLVPQGQNGGGDDDSDGGAVTADDLQTSLDSFLATKVVPPPPVPPAASATAGQPAFAFENAAPHAPPPVRLKTAPVEPSIVIVEEAEEAAAPPPDGGDGAPAPPAAFGALGDAFLRDVQSGLESLGYDLTSDDVMARLAGDAGLAGRLLPALLAGGGGGGDAAVLLEMVRRWQEAVAEQVEYEKEMKRKMQRPVWRCAVCGRYGCPVMPCIERFEEFEAP
jgi:hypothetical protein